MSTASQLIPESGPEPVVRQAQQAQSPRMIELDISGMHCAGCVGRVEKALDAIIGTANSLLLRQWRLIMGGGKS